MLLHNVMEMEMCISQGGAALLSLWGWILAPGRASGTAAEKENANRP